MIVVLLMLGNSRRSGKEKGNGRVRLISEESKGVGRLSEVVDVKTLTDDEFF
ncbi:hypothetical protein [Bacillus thuringiensis]|uniref:hypothetical protein n=1 Tax=Bacillus thuringiensis TaxID=1428 RepID=UPI00211D51EE|nr:hypothetical protein [Bacillus thuringiensis]